MANGLLAGIGAGLTAGTQSFQDARRLRMEQEKARQAEAQNKQSLALQAASRGLRIGDDGSLTRDDSLLSPEEVLNRDKLKLEVDKLRSEQSRGFIDPAKELDKKIKGVELLTKQADLQAKLNARPKPTVGEAAADRNFIKTYDELVIRGGEQRVRANIEKLREQANRLQNLNPGIVSRFTAGTPLVGPLVSSELEDIKNNVDSVSIEDLKATLGTQVTEGDRIAFTQLAFNPKLPPDQQAERIRKKADVIERSLNDTMDQVRYYEGEGEGSLVGYRKARLAENQTDDKTKSLSPGGLLQKTTRENESAALKNEQLKQGAEQKAQRSGGQDPEALAMSEQYNIPYAQALVIMEGRRRGNAR
ncbi:hypothetical protein [Microcystis sp. M061S2]|uniref:hypothetical protein n=1 Tax=Microcystis sp. M061S2 TaxID=2771171 RepID=UPI00258D5830|nr:hypothetical protein [Microcystis sp. M061S2]MCA2654569.1 hypothetical protein [Microcystis sp. M061S2]